MTFVNSVLLRSGENPEKAAKLLDSQCGEQKSGLETKALPQAELDECHRLTKVFAKGLTSQPSPCEGKELDEYGPHVPGADYRHNPHYPSSQEWCGVVYKMMKKRHDKAKKHRRKKDC